MGYETTKSYYLKEITANNVENPKTKLKADKEAGTIVIDKNTSLTRIPKGA